MRVCFVDVCWPYGCVLNMVMCVGIVDVCCPCLNVLVLLMCAGLGVACWPWRCMLALFMCVDIVDAAGLVAFWLIRFMVVCCIVLSSLLHICLFDSCGHL